MYARYLFFIMFASTATVEAQNAPVMLAGFGYTPPPSAVTAAPGQILTVSVYGIRQIDPAVAIPSPVNTQPYPPANVAGISVTLMQNGQPQQTPVGIYGIQQSKCSASDANCHLVSTFTLGIPFGLQIPADGSNTATLRIADQGTALADITVHPVTDNIHVVSTCDQTPIYVGLFSEASGIPGTCTVLVQHLSGMLVTNRNPAKVGETLTVWAYGLGAVDLTVVSGSKPASTVQSVSLSFDAEPNAPAIRPIPSADVTHPLTSLLAFVRGADQSVQPGLYQLNIVVPPYLQGPFAPCDSLHVQSNLTITVSGAASMDAAPICVAP